MTPEKEAEIKKEVADRRWKEKKSLAFDLGWIAAKQKKSRTANPYVSHELEVEGAPEKKEPTETEVLFGFWNEGYTTYSGSTK